MQNVKPLKKFGQNYLTDPNIIKKIISEISPKPDENLVEIGPGLGALTEKLIEVIPNFTSIEIDKRVINELRIKYPELNLINDDILNFNLRRIDNVANRRLPVFKNPLYCNSFDGLRINTSIFTIPRCDYIIATIPVPIHFPFPACFILRFG